VSPYARALTPLIAALLVVLALHDGGAPLDVRSLAGILGWWAVLVAVAFSLAPRAALPRAALLAIGFLGAFAVFTALSASWAPSAERAFLQAGRVLVYLGVAVVTVLATRRGDGGRWADGLALGIVIVATLALAQRLFPGLLPDDEAVELLPNSATRLSYPVGYWNGLGIFTALAVPLLLRAATTAGHPVWRGLAVAPFPVLAATVYLTSSRGGVAVAVLGAAVFLAITARRLAAILAVTVAAAGSAFAIGVLRAREVLLDGPFDSAAAESQGGEAALLILIACALSLAVFAALARVAPARLPLPRGAAVAAAVALPAVLLVAIVAADPGARIREFKEPPPSEGATAFATDEHLTAGGGSGRWQFWDAALEQFSEHPVAGEGAGSYEAWWAQHGTIDWFARNAHSLWLETLGELGLVGFLLLAGGFGVALLAGASRLRGSDDGDRTTVAALVALLVAFLGGTAIDWVWQLPAVAVVGAAAVGLLVGPATDRSGIPAAARGSSLAFGRRALLVLAAWLCVCALFVPFLGARELDASEEAVGRGDLPEALERADAARALQPWASSPRLQLALVSEEAGDLRAARARIDEAIDRDSRDWRLRVVAARLATKAGDIATARAALREARRLNPRSPALRTLPRR
jgi:hypothetical protein